MAMLEEQGYARKVKELWLGSEYGCLNLLENIGYFELLAHDREKGRFDFNPNKTFRPLKWKLERFSTFNL